MFRCPKCQNSLSRSLAKCPSCGFLLADAETELLQSEKRTTNYSHTHSGDSIDDARYVSGTILAGRYRIVGLLGKGGMGEVYRADDLKLSQSVALKFLPDHLLGDGAALARFHREVRVARQVSHKNVCRVYDIGEVNGQHFLSMEYIKGEELSSLLRRIGHLPEDKAIQVARQICAGLAAAHDNGVLHRDLKPANVMIDNEGNARILDFGLAGLAEEFREDEMAAGTPAYMAPEQLDGTELTVRSDIYSLGLVLYELFTGRRAFEAPTFNELMKLRRGGSTPPTPSQLVKDLDPAVERIIDRCLQTHPSLRPPSALQVAAALPGGDPLAAALAAGETPSPEMVAAAGREGALRPAVALTLLVSFLAGLIFVVVFARRIVVHGYVPLEKSPEVLRERAREILRRAGSTAAATDFMQGFAYSDAPMRYIASTDVRPERWEDLRDGQPAVLTFWYRQSPTYLGGFDHFRDPKQNPPPIVSGMAGVNLDTTGRLLNYYAVPQQVSSSSPGSPHQPSSDPTGPFTTLLQDAGFDLSSLRPVPSQWAPLYDSDLRMAWEGVYPQQSQIPVRIEAASYQGVPVSFDVVNPWTVPARQNETQLPWQRVALLTLLITIFVLVLVGSFWLAMRNLRLGRGDRKGALRLGLFIFCATLVTRFVGAHHVPQGDEFGTLLNSLQDATFGGCFIGIAYLALEPFVRRRWPLRIVSWTRLLSGDLRDPLVGRDMLIGAALGMGVAVWQISFHMARGWWEDTPVGPVYEPAVEHLGMRAFIEGLSAQITTPLLSAFELLFLTLLLGLILRRDWIGFVVGWLLFTAGLALLFDATMASWIRGAVTAGAITFALYRYGLLACLMAMFFLHMYIDFPVTPELTAWYASGSLLSLVIAVSIALFAFRTSLAGQKVFAGKLLEG